MTQDDIIQMAREATKEAPREDWNTTAWVFGEEALERFAQLVAAHEREQCAKVCDIANEANSYQGNHQTICDCAAAIRARGNI